ncbi:MAG: glycoside hydrolase family 127 protein [Bacteroidaceae bacterium]|nr:glycoside hydrolase family 127 protein [Bacteroidaceae bacterium]
MKRFFLGTILIIASFLIALGQEVKVDLGGPMGERFNANVENWLLTAPYANPGMTQMYFRRNQEHQIIVKWYGEFSGKYITSAALTYAMQPRPELKEAIDYVVGQLAQAQDADGYLGVWSDSQKFAGLAPGGLGKTWDVWAHYHNMLGLYYWYKISGSEQAKLVLDKAADCVYNYFVRDHHNLDEDKDGTDAAIGHIFALLYEDATKGKELTANTQKYKDMVEHTLQTFASETGGDYFNAGLKGIPFYQMKRRRWECLHAIQTIGTLYSITGEEKYRTAFTNIWRSIRDNDRHNTGGFSSGEAACGNPYDTRAIETCCTIAWMALCIDMLDMSDDPQVADELELSTWNAFLGAQHPSGRTFTYNTPMLGDRKASAHDIVFQAVAGSSELNCCSVNGPRGFGMLGQWGWQQKGDTITVNYYGSSEARITTAQGKLVTIAQSGNYPFGDDISLAISAPRNYSGVLRLRIPAWSAATHITVNGESMTASAGSYVCVPLRNKEKIAINFDRRLRFWHGERNLSGHTSIYIGPILLARDQRFEGSTAALDTNTVSLQPIGCTDNIIPQPYLLLKAIDNAGNSLILCDFASAGQTGTTYTTWLPDVR